MKHFFSSCLAKWAFSLMAFFYCTSLSAQTVVCVAPDPLNPGSLSPGTNCNAVIDSAIVLGPGTTADAPFTFTVRTYPAGVQIATGTGPLTVALLPYLNQIIEIQVIDQSNTTLTCRSYYRVEDKQAPSLTCPGPTDVACSASLDHANLPAITVTDNCFSSLTLSYVDVNTGPSCTLTPSTHYVQIARQWTVTDGSGNSSQCTQTINVLKAIDTDLVFPANTNIDCSSTAADPNVTGRPQVAGRNSGSFCNFSIGFLDHNLTGCGGNRVINRTWTAINTCSGTVLSAVQVISFVDNLQPTINCPPAQTISTSTGTCQANFILPPATASDNCSPVTITVNTPGAGSGFALSNVAVGNYTATYTATDGCGNARSCTTAITVADLETPSAVCEQVLTVSLPFPTGVLTVNASSFDKNSSDNCAPIEFLVSRNSTFGPTVTFTCADIGTPVMVTLRVREITNPSQFTDCMNTVTVQDRTAPVLSCPAPQTIDCNTNYSNLAIFGSPAIQEPCFYRVTVDSTFSISNCGVGSIVRRWTVRDTAGNVSTCTQTITVSNLVPFNGSTIIWPRDTTINNACKTKFQLVPDSLPQFYSKPVVNNNVCAMLFTSYSDQIYDMSSPACYKIIRTWQVWDMCQTPPNGVFTRQQVISLMDNTPPVIALCPPDTIVGVNATCTTGPVSLPSLLATDCSPKITVTHNSGFASAPGANASGNYPLGVHTVTFTVRDGCGNVATCQTNITVRDLKAPIAYCHNGIVGDLYLDPATGLPVTKFAPVWLNFASSDNCTPPNSLVFRARPRGSTNAPSTDSLVYGCDSIGTREVEMWVYDTSGNFDFCVTRVIIQNNLNHTCPPSIGPQVAGKINITGGITTETGEHIPGVTVGIAGSTITQKTNSSGGFEFRSLTPGAEIAIKPLHDYGHLNGVSTFDLVLIGRHVLNINPITSPYKLIAADVNNSGAVTTADMVELRKLILQIYTHYPQNKSWRFVDRSYVFPNAGNPFSPAFPEEWRVLNPSKDLANANFVGVKIGDVNGSASANFGEGAGDRTNGRELGLYTPEKVFIKGEELIVPISLNDNYDLLAIQFTLEFETDKLEFRGVEKGQLPGNPEELFGFTHLESGVLTAGWYDLNAFSAAGKEALFNLKFRAKAYGKLSEMLAINSSLTEALAYDKQELAHQPTLNFIKSSGQETLSSVVLYQNQPNPFNSETLIRFSLPENSTAKLSIIELSGRIIKSFEGIYNSGLNEVRLNRADLPVSGVLFYRLETPGFTTTRKMILLQ